MDGSQKEPHTATETWQRRFVRQTLTCRTTFSHVIARTLLAESHIVSEPWLAEHRLVTETWLVIENSLCGEQHTRASCRATAFLSRKCRLIWPVRLGTCCLVDVASKKDAAEASSTCGISLSTRSFQYMWNVFVESKKYNTRARYYWPQHTKHGQASPRVLR